jgi:hypothetical protein
MSEQSKISHIEKHYRQYTFLSIGTFAGVMLIGRLFRYAEWRSTAVSLVFILMMAIAIWGVTGYAKLSNKRGGYLYGQQRQLAILICSAPLVVMLLVMAIAAML